MKIFVSSIELYPRTRRSGQWIKKITFNFPVRNKGGELLREIHFPSDTDFPTLANTSGNERGFCEKKRSFPFMRFPERNSLKPRKNHSGNNSKDWLPMGIAFSEEMPAQRTTTHNKRQFILSWNRVPFIIVLYISQCWHHQSHRQSGCRNLSRLHLHTEPTYLHILCIFHTDAPQIPGIADPSNVRRIVPPASGEFRAG